MALPTVECFRSTVDIYDQATFIYAALLSKISIPVGLPTVTCFRALDQRDMVTQIYAAILQISGGGGGGVTSGDNWRYSGAGYELQLLNETTGKFNPVYAEGADGVQTLEIKPGQT